MTKILVTYDMFREGFTELESKYEVTFPEGRDFTYEEVLEMIPEYDVLCSMFDFPVNKELIDHASKLKMVANYAVGYNNIDVAYCLEKGITVANTPDPVTAPTANLALGLMLDVARRITECDRKLRREGLGMKVGVLENLGINVTGKTLGTHRKRPCSPGECLWYRSPLSYPSATVCRRRDKAERDIRFQGGAPLPIRFRLSECPLYTGNLPYHR